MEQAVNFYKEFGLVVEAVSGTISTEALEAKLWKLFSHPDYNSCDRVLCDMREADSGIDRARFRAFAKRIEESEEMSETRWAVVTKDPMLTAFSLVLKGYVERGGRFRVFSTLEAAAAYLGMESDSIEKLLPDVSQKR